MVSVRRVKYVIKLSIVALIVLSVILFHQWEDLSYNERVRRFVREMKTRDTEVFMEDLVNGTLYFDNDLLVEQERELDVDQILKKFGQLEEKYNDENTLSDKVNSQDLANAVHLNASDRIELHNSAVSRNALNKTTPALPHEEPIEKKKPTTKSSHQVTKPMFHINLHNNLHAHKFKNEIPKWKKTQWNPTMYGELNVHIWQAWCGSTTHDLRRNKFFPLWPDFHLTTDRFFIRHFENDYGQRVFGYLHPPVSGKYTFAVSSDDSSELWLSTDDSPLNVRLLAWVGNLTALDGDFNTEVAKFTKYTTQISRPIYLRQGQKYFVEALHKQAGNSDHLMVGWKVPGMSGLRHISGKSVSLYISDADLSHDVTEYAKYIPQDLPSHSHHETLKIQLDDKVHKFGTVDLRDEIHRAKLINESHINNLFPNCSYSPSYLVDFNLRRYQGVELIHDSAIYPDDHTDLTHMKQFDKCRSRRFKDSHGNKVSSSAMVPKLNNDSLYEEGRIKIFSNGKVNGYTVLREEVDAEFEKELLQFEGGNSEGIIPSVIKRIKRKRRRKQGAAHRNVNAVPNPSSAKKRSKKVIKKNKTQKHSRNVATSRKLRKSASYHDVQDKQLPRTRRLLAIENEAMNAQRRYLDSRETAREKRRRIAHAQRRAVQAEKSSKVSRLAGRAENSRSVQRPVENNEYNEYVLRGQVRIRRDNLYRSRHHQSHNNQSHEWTSHDRSRRDQSSHHQLRQSRSRHDQSHNDQSHERTSHDRPRRDQSSHHHAREGRSRHAQSRHGQSRQDRSRHNQPSPTPGTLPPWLMPNDSAPNLLYRLKSIWAYVRRVQEMVQKNNYRVNVTVLEMSLFRRWGIHVKVPSMYFVEGFTPFVFHQNITKCSSDSNLLLSKDVAVSVVHRYMKALNSKHEGVYSLKTILNVEENHDIIKGDRYLIELDLDVKGRDNPVRLSQFVYQKIGETEFCLPTGFVLNQHATVHVIVPVKNQGKWVQHFIDDMSELYLKTGDPHFNVIIVDFDSNDIDIEAALQRSDLKRYQLIRLSGPFQRALGVQAGAEAVTDEHDIIFTCDLHLEIPNNLIDIIRKHCVEGKMAFAPIVTRLHCGFTPTLPYGFWELQGYGLFAIYKSDFKRIGGMNYREFRTHWGGEDWEMLDRVLVKKIEVERLRIAKFYHFYHSRKGMWGESSMADTAKSNKTRGFVMENERIVLFEEDPTHYTLADASTVGSNTIPIKVSTRRKHRKVNTARARRSS